MSVVSRIKEAYRYFTPKPRFRKVPNQLISPYSMRGAGYHQRLLMKYGVARSPDEAKLLMAKYNANTALEVMERLPVKNISLWKKLRYRLIRLIRTIEGHDPRDHYKQSGSDFDIQYKYKR